MDIYALLLDQVVLNDLKSFAVIIMVIRHCSVRIQLVILFRSIVTILSVIRNPQYCLVSAHARLTRYIFICRSHLYGDHICTI